MRGIGILAFMFASSIAGAQHLPNTQPLTTQGDLAMQMVDGIGRWLDRATVDSVAARAGHWKRDYSSDRAYAASIEASRERLKRILGVTQQPEGVRLDIIAAQRTSESPDPAVARGAGYTVFQVEWEVAGGPRAMGLWLRPEGAPVANVIAIPDCSISPEELIGLHGSLPEEAQFARRLAENACSVLVPLLVDRKSGLSRIPGRETDIPHREFIQRAAFELGKTMLGYEVQAVMAAARWMRGEVSAGIRPRPLGVFGWGEGGAIALYSAAVDPLIDVAAVSGYFRAREGLYREPIDRNLFGILKEFGDGELASLVAPRLLIVEACRAPEWRMPGQAERNGGRAAPGEAVSPELLEARREIDRARVMTRQLISRPEIELKDPAGSGWPGSDATLNSFLRALKVRGSLKPRGPVPKMIRQVMPLSSENLFRRFVAHTQTLLRDSANERGRYWSRADSKNLEAWQASSRTYRDKLHEDVIGKLPKLEIPLNPRSRQIYDEPKYRGYEVTLDVYPDVFAYGILLVPKDTKEGERRPVVVCQHGLEGRPSDVADPKLDHPAYHRYACRLSERGFVVFAPQNPYIGGDRFRVLQRKANPLGLSLFSFITRQHERILEWLGTLPFVDSKRIAFYGLSYGGKTAMRVPALLEGYCLSICSADYNEWIWKNVSATSPYSYLFTNEYEMPEWNLGNTFNYAEMSWLIAPRPFMVERGHKDGVAPDEWVAYEYARTRRKYVELGIGDRTEIEFFDGPHMINGVGTFKFLHKHLNWPEPK